MLKTLQNARSRIHRVGEAIPASSYVKEKWKRKSSQKSLPQLDTVVMTS